VKDRGCAAVAGVSSSLVACGLVILDFEDGTPRALEVWFRVRWCSEGHAAVHALSHELRLWA